MPLAVLIEGLLLGMVSPAALQASVEAFSGQPALVDPRLLLPGCTRPDFAWAVGGRSVMVRCAVPEWRVFVPVGQAPAVALPVFSARTETEAPAVRRGERVTLEAGGEGFVIGMDVVAESDSKDGRVALRGAAGGRRLTGVVGTDGHVRLRGLSNMVNGR